MRCLAFHRCSHVFCSYPWPRLSTSPLLLSKFCKKDATFETKFPKNSAKIALQITLKLLVASWQIEIRPPNLAKYFTSEISNYKSIFTKKLHNTLFCRHGSAKRLLWSCETLSCHKLVLFVRCLCHFCQFLGSLKF